MNLTDLFELCELQVRGGPRFSIHEGQAHGTDPQRGLFCIETDIPIWGPVRFHRCLHIQV